MQRRHVADVSRHRSMNRLRQSELLSSQLARKLGKAIQSLRNIENLISLRLGRIFVSGGQVSLPQGDEDRFWRGADIGQNRRADVPIPFYPEGKEFQRG